MLCRGIVAVLFTRRQFSGTFTKLRKVAISFVMSVCLSVCPSVRMEQLGSYRMDFHEILYFIIFRKFAEETQLSLKYDKNSWYVTWRLCRFIIRSRWISGTTGSYRTDFHEILYFIIFRKSAEETQLSLKYNKNSWYLTWGLCRFIIRSRWINGTTGSYRTDFHEILYFIIFRKFAEETQLSLKYDKNSWYLTWGLCRFIIRFRWIHRTTRLLLDEFSWNFTFYHFSEICRRHSSFTQIWQEQLVLYMKTM